MNRDELLAELVAERFFGPPVRTDRQRAVPDMAAILAEIASTPTPIRVGLGVNCRYAACEFEAERYLDGWALCPVHLRKHASEVAS